MAAEIALRVNALNGEAGQVLHNFFPQQRLAARKVIGDAAHPKNIALTRIVAPASCGVKTKCYQMLGSSCWAVEIGLIFAEIIRACGLAGLLSRRAQPGNGESC